MFTYKRNGGFNRLKTFDSLHLISQLLLTASNLLKYKWITYLGNILYYTNSPAEFGRILGEPGT